MSEMEIKSNTGKFIVVLIIDILVSSVVALTEHSIIITHGTYMARVMVLAWFEKERERERERIDIVVVDHYLLPFQHSHNTVL